jgi:hypothetical protein
VLPYLQRRGYQVVTLSELAEQNEMNHLVTVSSSERVSS